MQMKSFHNEREFYCANNIEKEFSFDYFPQWHNAGHCMVPKKVFFRFLHAHFECFKSIICMKLFELFNNIFQAVLRFLLKNSLIS